LAPHISKVARSPVRHSRIRVGSAGNVPQVADIPACDRPQVDGTKSARLQEKTLQYPFKFFIEISTYVYLGFAVQYSFLRKFGYSTLSFGLLQATVAAQWGIIW
jgi:hypothetical protein